MDTTITRARVLIGGAALLCLLVVPFAVAGAAGDPEDPGAVASASTKKKVKKLSKKVKKLNKKVKALEGEQGQPRPPSGPAGGDLSGSYPNPVIAGGALGTGAFSSSIPAAHVTRSAAQSIPNDTPSPLAFNVERYDTAAMHNNATNNSRLRAPVTGIYAVTAAVEWGVNTTGIRGLELEKNGVENPIAQTARPASGVDFPIHQEVTTQVRLQAGEFVQARVVQDSGAPLDIVKDPDYTPEFSMTWLAPGP